MQFWKLIETHMVPVPSVLLSFQNYNSVVAYEAKFKDRHLIMNFLRSNHADMQLTYHVKLQTDLP